MFRRKPDTGSMADYCLNDGIIKRKHGQYLVLAVQKNKVLSKSYIHRLLGHFSVSPTEFYTSLPKPLVCSAALLSALTREKKERWR